MPEPRSDAGLLRTAVFGLRAQYGCYGRDVAPLVSRRTHCVEREWTRLSRQMIGAVKTTRKSFETLGDFFGDHDAES